MLPIHNKSVFQSSKLNYLNLISSSPRFSKIVITNSGLSNCIIDKVSSLLNYANYDLYGITAAATQTDINKQPTFVKNALV